MSDPRPIRWAVKAVIFEASHRCLLIRSSTANRGFVGFWEWPGGKPDPGEDLDTALRRELREETGLEVDLTGLAGASEYEMPAARIILVCLLARQTWRRVAPEPRARRLRLGAAVRPDRVEDFGADETCPRISVETKGTSRNTNSTLTDPTAAQKLTDKEWVALHVPRFKAVRGRYRACARFLESVLKAAVGKLAPMAIVNTRGKEITSFAEKILRKRALYTDPKDPLPPDPLVRMADLCGGRVITHTSAEVEKGCAFIKAAFDIDWPNNRAAGFNAAAAHVRYTERAQPTIKGQPALEGVDSFSPNTHFAANRRLRESRRIDSRHYVALENPIPSVYEQPNSFVNKLPAARYRFRCIPPNGHHC